MPHIKVAPFDTKRLDTLEYVNFRGVSNIGDEIIGVDYKREFLLHIKKRDKFFLIKPDKITRPIEVDSIKETLNKIANDLSLEIIHSNTKISSKKPKPASKYSKTIKDFISLEDFGFKEVALEVGFGSGRHLLFQAKKRTDTLFIGIEIHTPSIEQVLKQIELQQLKNIWIVNYDARLLLEMLPSNLLSNIYVHFPVPWDKKPHRRVINKEFLNESIRVLKKDATLELRTDSQNYYFYSLEIFSSPKKSNFKVQKNSNLEVISKYEARWRRQNKDIYTVTFTNYETSPKKELKYSFDFLECKPKEPKRLKRVFDDFFINIREVFKLKSGYLLEVAFGSFDRPEHKYILISDSKVSYFLDIPVPTAINQKAHTTLREILCQM